MRFTVLGPPSLVCDGVALDLGSPQQLAVLVLLLIKGRARTSELIDGLWGASAPPAADGVIRTYLCRLRQLPGLTIRSRNGFHELGPVALDADEFTALAGRARRSGGPVQLLEKALGLWTGTALAGVPGEAAERERFRLERARLDAVLELFELRLRHGEHALVAAEAPLVIHRYRLEERAYELYLVALHRCGRRAQALEVYRTVYALLGQELGVAPGQRLKRVHDMVIRAEDHWTG